MNDISGPTVGNTRELRRPISMREQFRICVALVDRSTAWQGLGVGVLILFAAVLEAIGIGLIFPFIKLLANPSQLSQMPWIGQEMGALSEGSEQSVLITMAIILLGIFVIKNIVLFLVYYAQNRFVVNNEALLARRLFGRYLRGAYAHHLTRNSAELIRNITGTVSTVFSSVFMGFITIASEFVLILALGVVLFLADPALTLGAAVALGIGGGIFYGFLRHRLVTWGERELKVKTELLQSLQQGLHSIKEVKVLGREDFIVESFARPRNDLARLQIIKNTMTINAPRLWIETIMITCILLVIILILAYGGTPGEIFAALTLFAAAAFRLIPSMNRILTALSNIRRGGPSVYAVYQDIKTFERETDADLGTDGKKFSFSKTLSVENMSFSYPNTDTLVLKGIDLPLHRGESIGFVGPSGAGKTTLVDIILGLLTPTSGRVVVDGIDIKGARRAWRRQIGYVPQSIYLFDDTLRRNIAFGLADHEIDEAKVRNAATLAQLDDMIRDLPAGLDTLLGERGARLSGGQAQRVGIARALYSDPPVLVLDEATSSLDNETEREINSAIERLSGRKTLIIIAHRLSTVRKCDRLAFLDDGRIIDSGTFEELNARNPEFCRLVELSKL